jgi:hypothetical protein
MSRLTINLVRVLLVVILLGTVVAQVWFFPLLAQELAITFPEVAWLRVPMLVVVILAILAVQVSLLAVWKLLAMVERDSVFSESAFGWVNVIIGAAVFDTVLVAGVNWFMGYQVHANPPGLMLMLLALSVGGATFALLMVLMKGLLRKASEMTTELSQVI